MALDRDVYRRRLENMRSRFNSAAGLQSQGYSAVCDLPLAPAVSEEVAQ